MTTAGVKIILVEPAGPLNVGSVARVMKNFGLHQLILVNPQCDHLGDEAKLMAVRAKDILENAIITATLPQALQDCKRAIATTGVAHDWEAPLETPRQALPWLLEEKGQPSGLIFGREDRGLTNQELNYAHKFVQIPANAEYTSLNLASAVAVCCYEMATCNEKEIGVEENTRGKEDKMGELAPLDCVETYYQELEFLLIKIGFLYPHTAASRMQRLRQLYNRAELRNRELAMLRGFLRQVEWAIGHSRKDENL